MRDEWFRRLDVALHQCDAVHGRFEIITGEVLAERDRRKEEPHAETLAGAGVGLRITG